MMKIFHIYRKYRRPSGFNVLAEDKAEAISISNDTYGICQETIAEEVKEEAGILVSEQTNIPFEPIQYPNLVS